MSELTDLEVSTGTELSVRTESIQRLYLLYGADRFRVNRRYQRKLVWSVEEKQRLIDSILQDLPLPLFLVAEIGLGRDASFELIDGMQRLNAICAFLENEYAVGGEYFDLDSLADTKLLKDQKLLRQRMPVLAREKSVQFANYSVALSVFRAPSSQSVDEVFRRINSGGRRLSRQELRQAGTISPLADLVRVISSRVRGDTSPEAVVPLRVMPKLSITNRALDYGVQVDDIFWVRHGILRREDVRTSLDEQLILDVLIDCLIDPLQTSGTDTRDNYYDFSNSDDPTAHVSLASQISVAIQTYDGALLETHVMMIYDEIREILGTQELRFSSLIGVSSGGRSPRYYHAVFMAIFELYFKDSMRVRDRHAVAEKLRNTIDGPLSIPGGSGNWTGESKRSVVDAVKGILRVAFEPAATGDDLSQYSWASQLETLLSNAIVEQQLFDCKQGFLTLDGSGRTFDADSFTKICKTLSAMANMGSGSVGHIAIGITDKHADTERVRVLDATEPVTYGRAGFDVVGLDREAVARGENLNAYWAWLVQRLTSNRSLDARVASQVAADARLVNYHGRTVAVLKVKCIGEPNFFDGGLWERSGSRTVLVPQAEYMRVYQRFA